MHACRLVFTAFLAFCLPLWVVGAESPAGDSFDSLVAQARALQAESSWALAREKFAEALKKAATPEAKRQIDYEHLNASVRAEQPAQNAWQAGFAWRERYMPLVEKSLADYPTPASRDEIWAGLTELHAFIRGATNYVEWTDWLALADFRAAAASSEEAARRYLELLRRISTSETRYMSADVISQFTGHLATALRIAGSADERAWFAREYALFSEKESAVSLEEKTVRWRNAAALARGTPSEAVVAAEEFLHRCRRGTAPGAAPDSPADLPVLLAELIAHRAAVAATPAVLRAVQIRNSLDDLQRWWTDPKVIIDAPTRVAPDAPVVYRYAATGYPGISIEVWRHSLDSWHHRAPDERELVRAGIYGQTRDSANKVRQSAELVRRVPIELGNAPLHLWQSEVRKLEPLPPGFYTLIVEGKNGSGSKATLTHLLVTSVEAIAARDSRGQGMLFVTTIDTHEAFGGKRISGLCQGERADEAWSGVTDDSGAIMLPAIHGPRQQSRLAALVDGQPVELESYLERESPESLVVDFVVDRALYRPGETVNWRLIARERRDGVFVVPKRSKLQLSLNADRGDEPLLDKAEIRLGAFGTAHGSVVIPKTASAGWVDLEVSLGEKEALSGSDYHCFLIDNFVPPAVVAKVDFPGEWKQLLPGSEITARVHVAYYSGGPVAGAPVMGTFSVAAGELSDASEIEKSIYSSWHKRLKEQKFTAVTDANGDAEVRINLPAKMPPSAGLHFSAEVTPEGGQAVEVDGDFAILPAGRRLDVLDWYSLRAARPGDELEFTCRVVDGRGKPVAFSGVAELVEKKWEEAWIGPDGKIQTGRRPAGSRDERTELRNGAGRSGTAPGWRPLHVGYSRTKVAAERVASAEDGLVRVKFKLPHAGLFQLGLADGEAKLAPSEFGDVLSVVAADEQTKSLALDGRRLRVIAPSPMRTDRPLEFLVIRETGPFDGVLTVTGENASRSQRFQFAGSAGWVTVATPPKFAGGGQVAVAVWGTENVPLTDNAAFWVDDESRRLVVKVQPADEEVRPGEKASTLIRVVDGEGKPVAAEVSLSVSDEAVNRLVREQPPSGTPFEYFTSHLTAGIAGSRNYFDLFEPRAIRDPRPGARLNPTRAGRDDYAMAETLEEFSVVGGRFAGSASMARYAPTMGPRAAQLQGGSIAIRHAFLSTAAWFPEIITDAQGEAKVSFTVPDNLTRWDLDAYAVGERGDAFGRVFAHMRASLPFQARLQTPRFLVAGDRAELSAVLVNRMPKSFEAEANLKVEADARLAPGTASDRAGLNAPPQGEARAGWPVLATAPGSATFTLSARTAGGADAMALTLPILADGYMQDTAASAMLPPGAASRPLILSLPQPFDATRTQVKLSFGIGSLDAVLDAMPYLIDYPYGCVEQTTSRFLPAVIAKKTLRDLGVAAETIEHRIMAGESRSAVRRRAKTAGLAKLDDVIEQSLARLASARGEERRGGYGWWPGQEKGDPWMTAYVGWGLALAQEAGCKVPGWLVPDDQILENARQLRADDERLAWTLVAGVRCVRPANAADEARALQSLKEGFKRAYAARDRLGPAGRACLALAAKTLGDGSERAVLLRNLENGVLRASAGGNDTAHWGATADYWRAMDGAVECTALTLLALLELDPRHAFVDPAVRWLILNRASGRWTNSRDTAFALLALTRHLEIQGMAKSSAEVVATIDGKAVGRADLNLDAALKGRIELEVPASALHGGENRIELKRTGGNATVYAAALASSWSNYESTRPAGHGVALRREFVHRISQPTVAGTVRFVPEPLAGSAAMAGEQITAVVTLEIPNALEYVMVSVPKPAGCEPLNPLSGWDARLRPAAKSTESAGNRGEQPIYREEKDDRSLFFLDGIEAGKWELRFGLRATTPGDFRAAPATIEAMYVPEIRGNTEALRVKINGTTQGGAAGDSL